MGQKYTRIWKALALALAVAGPGAVAQAGGFPQASQTTSFQSESQAVAAATRSSQEEATTNSSLMQSDEHRHKVAQALEQLYIQPAIALAPLQASPGSSLGAPMGFVASYGQGFIGVGGTTRDPSSHKIDGAANFGLGFGDPNKLLGGSISATIDSLNPTDGGFAADGGLGMSLGHSLPDYNASIAVGANRLATWGDADVSNVSAYFAASKVFVFRPQADITLPITGTVGFGNGNYRFQHDQNIKRGGIGFFVAAGVLVHEQVTLIADYTGGILNAGASMVPFRSWPVSLSLGISDINRQKADKLTLFGALSYTVSF